MSKPLEAMLLARRFVTNLVDGVESGESSHVVEVRSFKKGDDVAGELGGRDGNVVVTNERKGVPKAPSHTPTNHPNLSIRSIKIVITT